MKFRTILVIGLTATLVACGGTTSPDGDDGDSGGNSGNDNTGSDDADTGANRIGSLDDNGTFIDGQIDVATPSLRAGQSSALSVQLIDGTGSNITEGVDIFFSSPCTTNNQASIAPAVVTNSSGIVSTTYTAQGCVGADTITARTSIDSTTLTATGTAQTSAATFGAIIASGVSEPLIGLQGTGALPEQSTVSFTVTNSAGGPIPNQTVDFSLSTEVGGLALSNDSAVTDSNGIASTTVTSGTVATAVRVIASTMGATGQTQSAQSSQLAVTTGLPDNDSFSLSAETLNLEGAEFDGMTTPVTIRTADRFNNPVPDGTAITFTTEGGAIPGSCVTSAGSCTVTFTTQNPRPADGRATILATAIGEESFSDTSPSNGRFDEGEFDPDDDLPEAFVDYNEDGDRDSNEPYRDFNNDSSYTMGDNEFTGIRCQQTASTTQSLDCNTTSLNVRDQVVIVFSSSTQRITFEPATINLDDGNTIVTVSVGGPQGQVPPEGTTIQASSTLGSFVGPSQYEVMSTARPGPYQAIFELEPVDNLATDQTGRLNIEVATPQEIVSRNNAPISQSATP